MPKNFNVFRQVALGYILIVGLSIGLITPIVQAEAPTDNSYSSSNTSLVVDGLTQLERAKKIEAFLTERGNPPLKAHALDLVQKADQYGLPWTLVIAIAYNESQAGREECKGANGKKTYNAFGYRGCKSQFDSYNHAIDTVSRNLAGKIASTAHYYSGKTVEQKIDAWNPPKYNPVYKKNVLWTMEKIANTEVAQVVATTTGKRDKAVN